MPEPGQGTLSRQLTALIEAVLRVGRALAAVGLHHRWGEPPDPVLPPGAPADERPHHPGRRLQWHWVIDYYHACESLTKLSEALFSDPRAGASWRGTCAGG